MKGQQNENVPEVSIAWHLRAEVSPARTSVRNEGSQPCQSSQLLKS